MVPFEDSLFSIHSNKIINSEHEIPAYRRQAKQAMNLIWFMAGTNVENTNDRNKKV
jgi:hypothetical protein